MSPLTQFPIECMGDAVGMPPTNKFNPLPPANEFPLRPNPEEIAVGAKLLSDKGLIVKFGPAPAILRGGWSFIPSKDDPNVGIFHDSFMLINRPDGFLVLLDYQGSGQSEIMTNTFDHAVHIILDRHH